MNELLRKNSRPQVAHVLVAGVTSVTVTLTALLGATTAMAAVVTVKGASFDAPATCQPLEGALVCKVDGIQMELWVTRKPLAPQIAVNDTFARKMAYFNDIHDTAVGNILSSTKNDKTTSFSSYGPYSALGTAMLGKGVPSSPSVRFASVLHNEEIWEFLEVAATRTPAIESLSAALQRSLVLPAQAPGATPSPPPAPALKRAEAVSVSSSAAPKSPPATPPVPLKTPEASAPTHPTFSGPLLSLQYPDFLEPVVIENTVTRVAVNFKHKSRPSGPVLTVNFASPKDKPTTAANMVKARKDALLATITGPNNSVEVNALGAIKGVGFALIGVPDAKKGFSGVESIETTFAADATAGILDVRLTAESKFSADAETTWALLARSIQLKSPAK